MQQKTALSLILCGFLFQLSLCHSAFGMDASPNNLNSDSKRYAPQDLHGMVVPMSSPLSASSAAGGPTVPLGQEFNQFKISNHTVKDGRVYFEIQPSTGGSSKWLNASLLAGKFPGCDETASNIVSLKDVGRQVEFATSAAAPDVFQEPPPELPSSERVMIKPGPRVENTPPPVSGKQMRGKTCSKNMSEFECHVCNCYFEGGNQKLDGMIAIVQNVEERMRSNTWKPKTACGITWQPKQYSWTFLAKNKRLPQSKAVDQCVQAANIGTKSQQKHNYDHYWAPKAMKPKNRRPSWANHKNCRNSEQRVGDHIFCRIQPGAVKKYIPHQSGSDGLYSWYNSDMEVFQ